MIWVYVAAAAGLGCVAAWWLRRRSYRRDDDVVHRTFNPWWVPVLAAAGTLLASPFFAGRPALVAWTYLAAWVWALTLAYIDFDIRILPDSLVLPAYPVGGLLLIACSAVTDDYEASLRAAACAGVSVGLFQLAAWFSRKTSGLGGGDVTLAGVLGGLLGWFGWWFAMWGMTAGFVLGALGGLVLVVAGKANRRSPVSFGPAMVLGAYLLCTLGAAS